MATGALLVIVGITVLYAVSDLAEAATYVRWGKTACSGDAVAIYSGYVASAKYDVTGGGKNYICLADPPEWGNVKAGQQGSVMYGAQYVAFDQPFSLANFIGQDANQITAPCVVCDSPNNKVLMIPGRINCPSGWYSEYQGYLAANAQQASEWICVDSTPEPASAKTDWHAVFYPSEVWCGALPCNKYVNGNEVSCVVCSQ